MRKDASMDFGPRGPSEGQVSEAESVYAHIVGLIDNVPTEDYHASVLQPKFCAPEEFSGAFDLVVKGFTGPTGAEREGFDVVNFSEFNEEGTGYKENEPTILYLQRRQSADDIGGSNPGNGCYVIHNAAMRPDDPVFFLFSERSGDSYTGATFTDVIEREFKRIVDRLYPEEYPED